MRVIYEQKCGPITYQVVEDNNSFRVNRIKDGVTAMICGANSEKDAKQIVDKILERIMELLLENGLTIADVDKPLKRK